MVAWNYATLNEEGLRRFAFTLYDDDDSASLSAREIKDMFSEVCGDVSRRVKGRSPCQAGVNIPFLRDSVVAVLFFQIIRDCLLNRARQPDNSMPSFSPPRGLRTWPSSVVPMK